MRRKPCVAKEEKEALDKVLVKAVQCASEYLTSLQDRRVFPSDKGLANLAALDDALADQGADPAEIIDLLHRVGSPATVASAGGRYFGYVIGGSLPAALGANWLAGAWDQNAFMASASPVAARIEETALHWLLDVLRLPAGCGGAFVTGATMANFTALAAARHALLAKSGWNVEENGLFGAPEINVVVSEETRASVLKALSMLGLGSRRVVGALVDTQGRIVLNELPPLTPSTLVCTQAGNVNTGAFDPIGDICVRAHQVGAWVHVDGAFGLWGAATPTLAHLTDGVAEADSWATDGHKWLNVPYDSGFAFVRDPVQLHSAMASSAAYYAPSTRREPGHFTPESSRRARGIEVWAALRSLGRQGLADLIERTCRHARRFAVGLEDAGFSILNDVVLNQVLVSFGSDERTRRVIEGVQAEGTCWCGGTVWQGHTAMRISVCSWATTEEDVERSLASIIAVARKC
jgi:glutamate/tyrosine decarboxylase-like PLP-dependent enzyme